MDLSESVKPSERSTKAQVVAGCRAKIHNLRGFNHRAAPTRSLQRMTPHSPGEFLDTLRTIPSKSQDTGGECRETNDVVIDEVAGKRV